VRDEHVSIETTMDAYLAGELDGAAREAFERELAENLSLQREMALQQELDELLRAGCAAPADLASRALTSARRTNMSTAGAPDHAVQAGGGNPWLRRVALAAMLLLGAYGVYATWTFVMPKRAGYSHTQPWRAPMEVYQDTIAAGFKPAWVCKDDEEFIRSVRNTVGQRFAVRNDDPSVRVLGVAYSNTISPVTLLVLAVVDEQPAMLFVDRLRADRPLPEPTSDAIGWHRHEFGELVVYELSPVRDARVLPLVYLPPRLEDESCEPDDFEFVPFRQRD